MSNRLTKQFEIVNYKFGIFTDIPLDEFICNVLEEEPQYDLFQVIDGAYATLGGVTHYRYLLLKRKI